MQHRQPARAATGREPRQGNGIARTEFHRAAVGSKCAGQAVQQGGLPAAIASNESDGLTDLDGEVNAREDGPVSLVAGVQVAGPQRDRSRARGPRQTSPSGGTRVRRRAPRRCGHGSTRTFLATTTRAIAPSTAAVEPAGIPNRCDTSAPTRAAETCCEQGITSDQKGSAQDRGQREGHHPPEGPGRGSRQVRDRESDEGDRARQRGGAGDQAHGGDHQHPPDQQDGNPDHSGVVVSDGQ